MAVSMVAWKVAGMVVKKAVSKAVSMVAWKVAGMVVKKAGE